MQWPVRWPLQRALCGEQEGWRGWGKKTKREERNSRERNNDEENRAERQLERESRGLRLRVACGKGRLKGEGGGHEVLDQTLVTIFWLERLVTPPLGLDRVKGTGAPAGPRHLLRCNTVPDPAPKGLQRSAATY